MSFKFGTIFITHVFGESHGTCVGAVVEGCPPGLTLETRDVQEELDKRRPGRSPYVTPRREKDTVAIESGIYRGVTTGAPILMRIENRDVDDSVYERFTQTPRPGHADLTARAKYHGHHDHRGGGIFSGRMTAALVMAGAVARKVLAMHGITVCAHLVQMGNVRVRDDLSDEEIKEIPYTNPFHCADEDAIAPMRETLERAMAERDSVGARIECRVCNMPMGIGEPFFDSVESVVSHAIFSVPGVKGISFGCGFDAVTMRGSECNDPYGVRGGRVVTEKNDAGGVLGGLTNGMPVIFDVALKPTPSIGREQRTVDLATMEETTMAIEGRHDPCIGIRAVPVIEHVTTMAMADLVRRASL
ncbi:MAG TPA: chorismate synthase [Methanomicrobia archaeon]|nr:chorismate synthase [Methanomicrobia archaeon]